MNKNVPVTVNALDLAEILEFHVEPVSWVYTQKVEDEETGEERCILHPYDGHVIYLLMERKVGFGEEGEEEDWSKFIFVKGCRANGAHSQVNIHRLRGVQSRDEALSLFPFGENDFPRNRAVVWEAVKPAVQRMYEPLLDSVFL